MVYLKLNTAAFAVLVVATKPMTRFTDFREATGRWGYIRAIYALVMTRLYRHLGFGFCRITGRPLAIRPILSAQRNREYKTLTEAELLGFSKDPDLDMMEDLVRAALKRGDVCVGAIQNGVLIGYSWFAFEAAPHLDGLWVAVAREARYGYKSFVRPEFRGDHVATDVSIFSDEICMKKGKTFALGFIDTHNFASYRAARRAGARTLGYACYLNCGRIFFSWHSPGAKKHGFRFYKPEARR